jgi:SAM-dependent methyltransferase
VRASASHDEAAREAFLMGMYNNAMAGGPLVVAGIDLTGRRRLLDLGGGPGTYALLFCQTYPELEATVFDLPTSREFAERATRRFCLEGRVRFAAGDFLEDPLPGRYDVAWLSHILHGEGEENCRRIVAKAAAALEPGGLLLVHEFILDDDGSGPLHPALFALNMLVGTPEGRAYREGELRSMMEGAGLREIHRLAAAGPSGSGVLAGVQS